MYRVVQDCLWPVEEKVVTTFNQRAMHKMKENKHLMATYKTTKALVFELNIRNAILKENK